MKNIDTFKLEEDELNDLSIENCFFEYLNLKNIFIDKLNVNFTDVSIEITRENDFCTITPNVCMLNNPFSRFMNIYCKNIINKIYVEGNVLYCSLLFLFKNIKDVHAVSLIVLKNYDHLELVIYDPNGFFSYYQEYIEKFLDSLKKCLELNSNNFFKEAKIISLEKTIYTFGLQSIFEKNKNYGYCLIFSLFFIYCFCHVFEKIRNKNFVFLLYFINYFTNKYLKEGSEIFYFLLVGFANEIKDVFLKKVSTYKNKHVILSKLNDYIIYLINRLNPVENVKEKINSEYMLFEELKPLKNPEYVILKDLEKKEYDLEKKEYDLEMNLLDWKNIKEKRENEYCIENEECISKLCKQNKCTKPNDNDKLDFLTRLEWKEVEENEEIEKIKIFCKEKTFENFSLLNEGSKEFFIIGFNYLFKKLKDDNLKLTPEFKLYLQDTKNITDYKNKRRNFKKIVKNNK